MSSAAGICCAAARHLRQRAGRPAQQHVQRILRLAQGALQFGDGRDGAEVERLRLLHVQLGFVAALEKPFGDLEAALLQSGVLLREVQPFLDGADGRVETGGLRGDEHLHVVVLRDAGEVVRIRRLDAAPEPAPEVHLPGEVERETKAAARGARAVIRVPPDPQGLAIHLLELGKEAAPGDAKLRPGFDDPRAGNDDAGVGSLRLGYHLVEGRIVEDLPPLVTWCGWDCLRSGCLERRAMGLASLRATARRVAGTQARRPSSRLPAARRAP